MKRTVDEAFVQDSVSGMVDGKSIFSAVLRVESGDGSLAIACAAGDMQPDDRYYIASVTKLYITAVVLRLRAEGRLSLDDRIVSFFPDGELVGLHVLKGTDHTGEITVAHLISNTSGLPDYFFDRTESGKPAADELLAGKDGPWPIERILEATRRIGPRFRPGQKGRALYSDTNYELMGSIIERVCGQPIGQVFKEMIFDDLGLRDTYAYEDINDTTPAQLYYKSNPVHLPRYLASITAEGGIVSTAEECMAFLKAFFAGRYFPVEEIEGLKQWNLVFRPGMFLYGIGLEKIYVPPPLKPFFPYGDILGYWGQTSAFAWHNPQNDLYFTGTANQLGGSGHNAASKSMIKIIKEWQKQG
jgi:CubicO group peptidase (beta-lactamase class C family)